MQRTRNLLTQAVGAAALGAVLVGLGAGAAQADSGLPVVGGVPVDSSPSVAKGALQNSPLSPVRQSGTTPAGTTQEHSGASALIAGVPVPLGVPAQG